MTFQRSFDSAAVIIAAFNAEKTIAETLNSIVAQTMAVGMVVVVDDGSKDNTCRIVEQFTNRLPLVIHQHPQNLGPWAARNTAAHIASGFKILMFVDADDVLLPNHVSAHWEEFDDTVDVLATNYANWFPAKNLVKPAIIRFPEQSDQFRLILRSSFIPSFSTISNSIFKSVGGLRPNVTEDWDFWIRILRLGASVTLSKNLTYLYRWTPGSLSRKLEAPARDIATINRALGESKSEFEYRELLKTKSRIGTRFLYERLSDIAERESYGEFEEFRNLDLGSANRRNSLTLCAIRQFPLPLVRLLVKFVRTIRRFRNY